MNKKGFISMYLVYSFFLIFIIMMFTVLVSNNYKRRFLNTLKSDIKESVKVQKIEEDAIIDPLMP